MISTKSNWVFLAPNSMKPLIYKTFKCVLIPNKFWKHTSLSKGKKLTFCNWSLSSFWHNLTVLHGHQRVEQYTTSEVNHDMSFVYNSKTIEMCALKFDLIWKNIKLVYKLQFFLNLVLGQLSNLWVKLEPNCS